MILLRKSIDDLGICEWRLHSTRTQARKGRRQEEDRLLMRAQHVHVAPDPGRELAFLRLNAA